MNKNTHLSLEERKYIKEALDSGLPIKEIASKLNKHIATIYREINKGTVNGEYSPELSYELYLNSLSHKGKNPILKDNKKLVDLISHYITTKNFTVLEVVDKLKNTHGISITTNTIYSAIKNGLINNVTMESLQPQTTKMFSKGLIQIPKHIREELNLKDGDIINIKLENNIIILDKKISDK